jgi:hypothetical protein
MKNRTAAAVLLAIFALLASSCSKDENTSRKLTRTEFREGKIRVFTSSGEVADNGAIDRFVSTFPKSYSFKEDITVLESFDFEIELLSNNEGRLNPKIGKPVGFTIQRKDGVAYFILQDTVKTPCYTVDERFKCQPVILKREPISLSTGYSEFVTFLRTLYGREVNGEVHLSIISVMEKKYFDGVLKAYSFDGTQNNMTSESYLDKIKSLAKGWTDTIAYKESHIIFK